ncbi:MAG: OmpH family outer membrane protein [Marinifilaceae bacterium]
MKNLSVILNIVLLVAVGALYVIFFTYHGKGTEKSVVEVSANAAKVVYINTDTLLNKYKMAQELNEAFLKTQEERRTELNVKARELDKEANEFEYKVKNNGFISEARAIDARDQILLKQQKLQKLQQEMTDKMLVEQSELNKKLYDSITEFLKDFNRQHNYNIVLSTTLGGNVLFAQEGYDITEDVITGLNQTYKN